MFNYLQKSHQKYVNAQKSSLHVEYDSLIEYTLSNNLLQLKQWLTDELSDFYASNLIYYYNQLIRSTILPIQSVFGLFDESVSIQANVIQNLRSYSQISIVKALKLHIIHVIHHHNRNLAINNLKNYFNFLNFADEPLCPFTLPTTSLQKQIKQTIMLLISQQLLNVQLVAAKADSAQIKVLNHHNFYKFAQNQENCGAICKYISFPQLFINGKLLQSANNQLLVEQYAKSEKDDMLVQNTQCKIQPVILSRNRQLASEETRLKMINVIVKLQKLVAKEDDGEEAQNYMIPRLVVTYLKNRIQKKLADVEGGDIDQNE